MQEIVTFLKSLLSRKFALAVAAFITVHQPQIPARYQAIASVVIAGLYFLANVQEKKVNGTGTSVVVNNNASPAAPGTGQDVTDFAFGATDTPSEGVDGPADPVAVAPATDAPPAA